MLDDLKKHAQDDMEKVLKSLDHNYHGVRTGRASPNILDNIKADVYGVLTPLAQIAQVTVPEPKMLVIQSYDKNTLKPIEKAIRESSLGLNPMIDGDRIRIMLPDLTQERRQELVKHLSKITEEARIAVRLARQEALGHAKKMDISENDQNRFKTEIQKLTDQSIEKIDSLFEKKKMEIMKV